MVFDELRSLTVTRKGQARERTRPGEIKWGFEQLSSNIHEIRCDDRKVLS